MFRSPNFLLLTLKKKNRIVLAVDLVEGVCRHTMCDVDSRASVHVDEVAGYSTTSRLGWTVVHGFQYTRLASGQLRLLVVTPDGDLQESFSEFHAPLVFDGLTIGPAPGLVLHELCMFPCASLTDRQMVEVFTELRNRWY